MAHWFHRNPIKATANVNFNESKAATEPPCTKICSMAKDARTKLLDLLCDPKHDQATVKAAMDAYFSLLQGFITSCNPNKPGPSKLKHLVKSRWSSSLLGPTKTIERWDANFELLSMLANVAIWYTKRAAFLAASTDAPTMDLAKEVHTCLRTAAGHFKLVESQLSSIEDGDELSGKLDGSDLDKHVLSTYISQCQAEAQEITIARAIELQHSPSIISALAYETAKLYEQAEIDLRQITSGAPVEKWRQYCALKNQFYLAYAFSYHGEVLLAKDLGGEAIRCLQEAAKCFDKAADLSKAYTNATGPCAHSVNPTKHLFFRKLQPIITRHAGKAKQQNDLIYHQKVPLDPPKLELKATFGLVSPNDADMPPPHELWTAVTYDSFDHSQGPSTVQREQDKTKKADKVEQPKEKPIDQSDKDPNSSSGCIIS